MEILGFYSFWGNQKRGSSMWDLPNLKPTHPFVKLQDIFMAHRPRRRNQQSESRDCLSSANLQFRWCSGQYASNPPGLLLIQCVMGVVFTGQLSVLGTCHFTSPGIPLGTENPYRACLRIILLRREESGMFIDQFLPLIVWGSLLVLTTPWPFWLSSAVGQDLPVAQRTLWGRETQFSLVLMLTFEISRGDRAGHPQNLLLMLKR